MAAIAAEVAVTDRAYVADYVAKRWHRAICCEPDSTGWHFLRSQLGEFSSGYFGIGLEVRDALREHAILVRDRSYEIPAACASHGTREQTRRLLDELEQIW